MHELMKEQDCIEEIKTLLELKTDCFGFIAIDEKQVCLFSELVSQSSCAKEGFVSVYSPDFFLSDTQPWWNFKNIKIIERFTLDGFVKTPVGLKFENESTTHFETQFSKVQELLNSKQMKKVVLTHFEKTDSSLTQSDKLNFLQNALSAPSCLFPYALITPEKGIVGTTPEILFRKQLEKNKWIVSSIALAGTTSKIQGKKLLEDVKETLEHEIVVDEIMRALGIYGIPQKSKTYEYELPTLVHLRTDLEVECDAEPLFSDLISRLHPTPALGGSPRIESLELLKQFDKTVPRNRFGSPFGIHFPNGESLALVAIRNIQWSPLQAFIGAGCGIVQGSKVAQEWNEIKIKQSSVKQQLGIQ